MRKSKNLLIVGLSNNSKIASYYFERDTEYNVIGFCVDKEYINESTFCNLPIFDLESIVITYPPDNCHVFVATGYTQMNSIRESLYKRVKEMGYFLPNYISPNCIFLSEGLIGDNNFILEDNTIQPFVVIGSNNIIWSGNHIGHDVIIGDHNFITSHVVIAGFTKICNNTFLGINSTISGQSFIKIDFPVNFFKFSLHFVISRI